MKQFLMEAGPVILPIIFLALLIVFLVLWNTLFLLFQRQESTERRRRSIDSVLFWAGFAAVLGFLGFGIGLHKQCVVVYQAGGVNPELVTLGLSEAFLTPVSGLAVLTVASFFWFFLRLGLWTRDGQA